MAKRIDASNAPPHNSSRPTHKASTPITWFAIVMPVMIAAVLWGISLFFPGQYPLARADSFVNWLAFGERILRDTLRAAAVLALATSLAVMRPGIGLWVESVILHSRKWVFLTTAAILAVVSSGLFSYDVFAHFPHIQDEIAMLFQAKILASGRWTAETPALPDFFDWEFIVMDGPRWYGKYFAGSSLALIPGLWLGVPWLVNPVLAGVAVGLTYAIGRDLFSEKIGRIATVLMVLSPFRINLFALMMGHPICLIALALYTWSVIRVVKDPRQWVWSLMAGVSLGFAVNCRPLTALAMGLVIGLAALFWMPWRHFGWRTAVAFVVPFACGVVAFFGYNKVLTGDATLTPFAQWSPKDTLGFGPDVGLEYWPEAERGLTLRKAVWVNGYFNLEAIAQYLTHWGNVALVLLIWPVFRSLWPKRTMATAAVAAGLVFAYLFYHTHSVVAGQARYWSEAMPMMILLVAVALAGLRRRMPMICRWLDIRPAIRTGRSAVWLAATILTLWSGPGVYRALIADSSLALWGQDRPPALRDLAGREKLDHALVFVKAHHFRNYGRDGVGDTYGYAFAFNNPDLNGPVVYARDLGERNAELIAQYPTRTAYRFVLGATPQEDRFVPIPND